MSLILSLEVNCHSNIALSEAAYLVLNIAVNKLTMLDGDSNGYGFLSGRKSMTQIILDELLKMSGYVS